MLSLELIEGKIGCLEQLGSPATIVKELKAICTFAFPGAVMYQMQSAFVGLLVMEITVGDVMTDGPGQAVSE
jgi:hypothetical protein